MLVVAMIITWKERCKHRTGWGSPDGRSLGSWSHCIHSWEAERVELIFNFLSPFIFPQSGISVLRTVLPTFRVGLLLQVTDLNRSSSLRRLQILWVDIMLNQSSVAESRLYFFTATVGPSCLSFLLRLPVGRRRREDACSLGCTE